MSDRWGPSIDCPECGQTCSSIDMRYDDETGETLCKDCYEQRNPVMFWTDDAQTFNRETDE